MNLKTCPSCKGQGTIRAILWGMPKSQVDESKYVIGGCCISENDSTHECIKCGWKRYEETPKFT